MIKIETIEKDIADAISHLHFMNRVLDSYKGLEDVFQNRPELKKYFTTEIENFHSIVTLAQLEISLSLKAIYYAKCKSEKSHLIKRGLLVLYEIKMALDKLNPVFKKIKDDYPELENEFKEITIIIKQAKRRIADEPRIMHIRNNISAHINTNFLENYKYLETVDLEEDIDLIIRMKLILNELNNFLLKDCINQLKK